jgi:hypothetical protein
VLTVSRSVSHTHTLRRPQQIAAGATDPIYLLQGEDDVEKSGLASEFAEIVEDGLRAFNVERIHGGDMTTGEKIADGVASIIDAVRTLPMMAPRRVVIVMQAEALLVPKRESEAAARALEELEALFERPEAQTTPVLVAAPLDKRTKMWKPLQKQATIVECGVIEDLAAAQQGPRARAEGVEISRRAGGCSELAGSAAAATGDQGRRRVCAARWIACCSHARREEDHGRRPGRWSARRCCRMTGRSPTRSRRRASLRQLALALDAGAPPEKILDSWLRRAR